MFQNISDDINEDTGIEYEELDKKLKLIKRLKDIFSVNNVIIYIIAFMVSKVSFGGRIAPFGLAFLAASLSNNVPLLPVWIIAGISTGMGFGKEICLQYFITSILFIGSMLIFRTKLSENGKLKLGVKLFICTIIVQAISVFTNIFLIYDLLTAIFLSICVCIFYKIFSNSIYVVKDYTKVFSPEEIVGASLMATIAFASLGDLNIAGFVIRNILSILLVLILGWQNGILVGGTSGIAIGVVLAIINVGDMTTIASFAFSGMIAGALSRFGKIGVVLGFFVGNAVLTYVANGYAMSIIYIREIFIASLGLLLLPKKIVINIEDIFNRGKTLENTQIKQISGGRQKDTANEKTVYKINTVSDTISEMAENFTDAASSTVEIEDLNIHTNNYIKDLRNSINNNENKLFYKDILEEDKIIIDIHKLLDQQETVNKEQFMNILENNNQYIILNEKTINDIDSLVAIINDTYKVSKVNYFYEKKIENSCQTVAKQLNNVSKLLDNLAVDIEEDNNVVAQNLHSGVHNTLLQEAKYTVQIGIANIAKNGSIVSGDSSINTLVQNNKLFIGLSDGMGSGEKAKDKSGKVLRMLEKLLNAGFKSKEALNLINSSFSINNSEEYFATLDGCVVNLETGIAEFMKLSGCPTYIKRPNKIEMVKTANLPVGIIEDEEIEVFRKTLKHGDLLVFCTDGAIEYNTEYENKELWIKKLLQNIKTDNPQKIGDLILNEAIDNGFGIAKDDISVIVAKVLLTNGELKIL